MKAQPATDASVQALVRQAATSLGSTSTTNVLAVSTTRSEALAALDAGESSTGDAGRLVQLQGDFTTSKTPSGASPARGSVLSLVIDTDTGRIMDLSIANATINHDSLGTRDETRILITRIQQPSACSKGCVVARVAGVTREERWGASVLPSPAPEGPRNPMNRFREDTAR